MVASPVTVPIQALNLSPGSHILIENVTWEEYESLLEELGWERSLPRINYSQGILELMTPLPAHERPHRIISDIVKMILTFQERDWEDFGSTIFKQPQRAGLEPDTCFYIENATKVRSAQRIDLATDPPPDLAIEVDVTSKTTLQAYQGIGVPEVWIFAAGKLKIYLLTPEGYQESDSSPTFANLDIVEMMPQLVQQAFTEGTRQMLRSLRQKLSSAS